MSNGGTEKKMLVVTEHMMGNARYPSTVVILGFLSHAVATSKFCSWKLITEFSVAVILNGNATTLFQLVGRSKYENGILSSMCDSCYPASHEQFTSMISLFLFSCKRKRCGSSLFF